MDWTTVRVMRMIIREMRTSAQTNTPSDSPPAAASLASVLFGKSMQAILTTLYGRPDEEFYLRELARVAAITASSLQRDLAALVGAGIVLRAVRGHQVYFRANRACPVLDELRGLVVKTFGVADVLKQALQQLSGNIDAAFVYGSVARGEERAASDIDLFLVGEVSFAAPLGVRLKYREYLLLMGDDLPQDDPAPGLVDLARRVIHEAFDL